MKDTAIILFALVMLCITFFVVGRESTKVYPLDQDTIDRLNWDHSEVDREIVFDPWFGIDSNLYIIKDTIK